MDWEWPGSSRPVLEPMADSELRDKKLTSSNSWASMPQLITTTSENLFWYNLGPLYTSWIPSAHQDYIVSGPPVVHAKTLRAWERLTGGWWVFRPQSWLCSQWEQLDLLCSLAKQPPRREKGANWLFHFSPKGLHLQMSSQIKGLCPAWNNEELCSLPCRSLHSIFLIMISNQESDSLQKYMMSLLLSGCWSFQPHTNSPSCLLCMLFVYVCIFK